MTKAIELRRILQILGEEIMRVIGNVRRSVTHPAPIKEARNEFAITFCTKPDIDALELIRSTKAGVVVCRDNESLDELGDSGKTLIVVRNPRLSFIRLIKAVFAEPIPCGIHPTAVIDPDANIHPDVYIGPFTYVGKCEIGEGTVIYGHVHIYGNNVKIGKNVVIHAGTIIGVDGFGYSRNESNELEYFPSLGGVIIEDDVEIHSNVNVDKGTLSNTVIGKGTKIDKFCHIGHNVVIGKHCVITAHGMFGGSAQIGDYTLIAPCVCIRDGGIRIGSHAFVGMAAVVTKDVPDGVTVMGAPARPIETYKQILKAIKEIAGVE
jgi:UDP-3-O-[3-hydroxymyristoyl] glucosamine N-acyltransferase